MGDISRMGRADRFIKVFGVLAAEKLGIPVGTKCEITACGLGLDEICGVVRMYANLTYTDQNGKKKTCEIKLHGDLALFDPSLDGSDDDDTIERLVENLDITEEKARELLREAKL